MDLVFDIVTLIFIISVIVLVFFMLIGMVMLISTYFQERIAKEIKKDLQDTYRISDIYPSEEGIKDEFGDGDIDDENYMFSGDSVPEGYIISQWPDSQKYMEKLHENNPKVRLIVAGELFDQYGPSTYIVHHSELSYDVV